MDPLITVEQAKLQLRLSGDDYDDELALKIEDATGAVLGYLEDEANPDWTDETVPLDVRAAVLEQLADMWRNRGDQDPSLGRASDRVADGYLSPRVTRLLYRRRMPTLS